MSGRDWNIWKNWFRFAAGYLIGKLYKALPAFILYVFTGTLLAILVNSWSVHTHVVLPVWYGVGVAVAIRLLGMLWRGEKNPLIRKMRTQNSYE